MDGCGLTKKLNLPNMTTDEKSQQVHLIKLIASSLPTYQNPHKRSIRFLFANLGAIPNN